MSEYNGKNVPDYAYAGEVEFKFLHYVSVEEKQTLGADESENKVNTDSAQLVYLSHELEDSKIFPNQKILTFALVLLTENLEHLPSSNMTEEYLINLFDLLSEAWNEQYENKLIFLRPFTFSENTCVKTVEPKTNQIIHLNAVIGTIGAQTLENFQSGAVYRQGSSN